MDLQELKFIVRTEQLDDAVIKVKELGAAVQQLNKPLKETAQAASNLDKAVAKTNKAVESQATAAKKAADTIDPLTRLIEKLDQRHKDMAAGFTKGEASILNQARNLGAFGAELQPVISLLEKIKTLNKDPFDASLGGVRSITQEFEKLQQRANLAAQGIVLTTKQLGEYSRLAAEAAGKVEAMGLDPKTGEGLKRFNDLLSDSQKRYLDTVAAVNKLTAEEKQRIEMLKEQERLEAAAQSASAARMREWAKGVAKQTAEAKQLADMYRSGQSGFQIPGRDTTMDQAVVQFYKQKEAAAKSLAAQEARLLETEKKLAFTNAELAAGLSQASANALYAYRTNLEKLGKSQEEVAQRTSKFREMLVEKQSHSPIKKMADDAAKLNERMDHLSRAIAPQITDIFVGLATGQSPLTIMLQQGGQLRDQFGLAGVEGKKMGDAIVQASKTMIPSIAATAGAIGQLLISSLIGAGEAAAGLAAKMSGLPNIIEMTSAKSITMGKLLSAALGAGLFALAGSLTALAVGFAQTIKQESELSKALAISGASLGISRDTAVMYAKSLESIGVSTSFAIDAITQMAKAGGFSSSQMDMVIVSAQNMQKYAGIAIEDTVKAFAKMRDKPVESLVELAKSTGLVSPEVVKLAVELDNQGKVAEAAAVAMKALADANSAQAKRIEEDLHPLQQLFIDLKDKFDSFYKSIKEFSRGEKDTLGIRARAQTRLAIYESLGLDNTLPAQREKETLESLNRQALRRQENLDIQKKQSAEAEMISATEKLRIKNLDEVGKKQLEINKLRNELSDIEIQYGKNSEYAKVRRDAILKIEKDILDIQNKKTKIQRVVSIDNTALANLNSLYSAEMKTIEANNKATLSLNQLYYDLGLKTRAEYIQDSTSISNQFEKNQIDRTKQYIDDLVKLEQDKIARITAERDKQIARSPSDAGALRDTYQKEVDKAKAEYEGKRAVATESLAKIEAEANQRVTESYKVLVKIVNDSKNAYDEFTKSQEDSIAKRREQLALEQQVIAMHPQDAAGLRAKTEAMNQMIPIISKLEKALSDLDIEFRVMESSKSFADMEQLIALSEARANARKNLKDARAKSEEYADKARIDAETSYYLSEYKKVASEISDVMFMALTGRGADAGKKLRDMIKAKLMEPITIMINAVVNQVFGGAIESLLSAAGINLPAGSKSGSVNVGNLVNAASTAKTAYSAVTTGFGSIGSTASSYFDKFAMSKYGQQLGLSSTSTVSVPVTEISTSASGATTSSTTNIASQQTSLTDIGQSISSAASKAAIAVAATVVGNFLYKKISGGYSINKGMESINKMAIAAANLIPGIGPIASLAVGITQGIQNRLYGRKLKEVGVMGTFGPEGFEGSRYKFEKGGILRSDKTTKSALDTQTKNFFSTAFAVTKYEVQKFTDYLGVGAKELENFTYKMRINLKGLSDKQITEKLQKEFDKVKEAMAAAVLQGKDYSKENETSFDTLKRLATTLQTVNGYFKDLGVAILGTGYDAVDAALNFTEYFGGVDKFGSRMASFYDKFFTETEKTDNLTRNLGDAFTALGLEMPKTKAAFREMVLTAIKAGDPALTNNLLDLQDSFLLLNDSADKAAEKMKELVSSIVDEVNRLRGEILGDAATSGGLQGLMAEFATATAQARAGDTTALERLPELSKLVEEATIAGATSASDVVFARAWLAQSLQDTSGVIQGTPVVTTPDVVTPTMTEGSAGTTISSATSSQTDLIAALISEIQGLRAEVRADVSANTKTSKILERVNQNGDRLSVTTVA